jgi:hypothetical protein
MAKEPQGLAIRNDQSWMPVVAAGKPPGPLAPPASAALAFAPRWRFRRNDANAGRLVRKA